ncbi:hypothetical protein [Alishewanella longhuensis]
MVAQALQLRQQYPALQQQAVALSFSNLHSFVVAILAFDGWSRALYLLPDNSLALPEPAVHWPAGKVATEAPLNAVDQYETATLSICSRWYLATSRYHRHTQVDQPQL